MMPATLFLIGMLMIWAVVTGRASKIMSIILTGA